MESSNNFNIEDSQQCPYHKMLLEQDKNGTEQNENTGDWGDFDEDDEAGTDPDRNENGGNDNSGGAGSSGSAATNS